MAAATAAPPQQYSFTSSSTSNHIYSPTPTTRPVLGPRQPSTSMIVPADHPEIESKTHREFPPDDARAMSPRQSNENLQQLCGESRNLIINSSLEHQSSLTALLEKIESVKSGHEKLERDNNALQEYIGGLTRSMSSSVGTTGSGLGRSGSSAGAASRGVERRR